MFFVNVTNDKESSNKLERHNIIINDYSILDSNNDNYEHEILLHMLKKLSLEVHLVGLR